MLFRSSEKAVFCLRGAHKNENTGREVLPFALRLSFYRDSESIHITHSFLYDGDEKKDFLKGLGIHFACPLEGEPYNHHVKYENVAGMAPKNTSRII